MAQIVRFRAPMAFGAYCKKLRIDPECEDSKARYRAYYVGFKGD